MDVRTAMLVREGVDSCDPQIPEARRDEIFKGQPQDME